MAKKTISLEDSQLFRQSVGNVRKINCENTLPNTLPKPKPFPKTNHVNVQEHLLGSIQDGDLTAVSVDDSLSYLAPGLQNKVLKKLRQGYFGVAAEIDLHGLGSNEAKRQLLTFLHLCVQDGYRCVHIIHGKGYRSTDNHPILKNNLNLWLRQHQAVQAFCSASQKHGGTGAVFVLLQLPAKLNNQAD